MHAVLDIAHGDIGTAQRRTRQPRGDDADLRVRGIAQVDDDCALAGRTALLDCEADAALREGLGGGRELREDGGGAVEGRRCGVAAVLADDPAQGCGGGCLRGGDVVAVQAHACLEAEGVAGCEAGEPDLVRVGEEELGDLGWEGGAAGCGDGDLEAVLAGVAGSGDEEGLWGWGAVGQGEVQGAAVAEVEGAEISVGGRGRAVGADQGLEDGGGERALQGDESPVVEDLPFDTVGAVGLPVRLDLGLQEGQVLGAAASVGDEVKCVAIEAGNDGIVDNAAGAFFKQAGECRGVRLELV